MKHRPLFITKSCHKKLLRWSLISRREIGAICFGTGRTISVVHRLRNIERSKYACDFNSIEANFVKATVSKKLKKICEAHSHPQGPPRPSRGDIILGDGHKEIIICTKSKTVTLWRIGKTYKQTLKHGQIPLIVTKEKR